jgi:AcrR family transcriptional regulator
MNKTDDKIMGAALKLFAEKGYVDAGTRFIADEADFSEMTLFRSLKPKKISLKRY